MSRYSVNTRHFSFQLPVFQGRKFAALPQRRPTNSLRLRSLTIASPIPPPPTLPPLRSDARRFRRRRRESRGSPRTLHLRCYARRCAAHHLIPATTLMSELATPPAAQRFRPRSCLPLIASLQHGWRTRNLRDFPGALEQVEPAVNRGTQELSAVPPRSGNSMTWYRFARLLPSPIPPANDGGA